MKLWIKRESSLYPNTRVRELALSIPPPPNVSKMTPVRKFFVIKDNRVPGPGQYESLSQSMSKYGSYYISNMSNSLCRSFTRDSRDGVMKSLKERSMSIISLNPWTWCLPITQWVWSLWECQKM